MCFLPSHTKSWRLPSLREEGVPNHRRRRRQTLRTFRSRGIAHNLVAQHAYLEVSPFHYKPRICYQQKFRSLCKPDNA